MAGKIVIDTERCKGCGLCVVVCPKKSIVISEESNQSGYFPARKTDGLCTGCAQCAIVCPEGIIQVCRDQIERMQIVSAPGRKKTARPIEEKT